MGRAAEDLKRRRAVTDVCFDVGFASLGTFGRTFREIVGETPRAYRAGHGPVGTPQCVQLAALRPRGAVRSPADRAVLDKQTRRPAP